MGRLSQLVLARSRDFFTNWQGFEGPFGAKVKLTLRNRARALMKGCCGHPGEPGC